MARARKVTALNVIPKGRVELRLSPNSHRLREERIHAREQPSGLPRGELEVGGGVSWVAGHGYDPGGLFVEATLQLQREEEVGKLCLRRGCPTRGGAR